jgi:hypothetical protein
LTQLRYICYFKETQFTLLNVINYQDFLYGISLPDIHRDLVSIVKHVYLLRKNFYVVDINFIGLKEIYTLWTSKNFHVKIVFV